MFPLTLYLESFQSLAMNLNLIIHLMHWTIFSLNIITNCLCLISVKRRTEIVNQATKSSSTNSSQTGENTPNASKTTPQNYAALVASGILQRFKVSLFNGISTLFRLFNANAILLEKQ